MNKKIGILTLLVSSAIAQGDVISQVVDFDAGFDGDIITFDQFDTMGGTRELTGLSLSYDQTISLEMSVESNGYTALSAGDWLAETSYISIHQFGLNDGLDVRGGDGNPGPPYIGPGAIGQSVSGYLGISDGYQNGGEDTIVVNISDSYTFNASYDGSSEFDQRMFDAFTGEGQLDTFLGGFIELFFSWVNDPNWVLDPNNPPDGPWDGPFGQDPYYGVFVEFLDLSHKGSITVNYEYATVPTPSGSMLFVGAGLLGLRRRR